MKQNLNFIRFYIVKFLNTTYLLKFSFKMYKNKTKVTRIC